MMTVKSPSVTLSVAHTDTNSWRVYSERADPQLARTCSRPPVMTSAMPATTAQDGAEATIQINPRPRRMLPSGQTDHDVKLPSSAQGLSSPQSSTARSATTKMLAFENFDGGSTTGFLVEICNESGVECVSSASGAAPMFQGILSVSLNQTSPAHYTREGGQPQHSEDARGRVRGTHTQRAGGREATREKDAEEERNGYTNISSLLGNVWTQFGGKPATSTQAAHCNKLQVLEVAAKRDGQENLDAASHAAMNSELANVDEVFVFKSERVLCALSCFLAYPYL